MCRLSNVALWVGAKCKRTFLYLNPIYAIQWVQFFIFCNGDSVSTINFPYFFQFSPFLSFYSFFLFFNHIFSLFLSSFVSFLRFTVLIKPFMVMHIINESWSTSASNTPFFSSPTLPPTSDEPAEWYGIVAESLTVRK